MLRNACEPQRLPCTQIYIQGRKVPHSVKHVTLAKGTNKGKVASPPTSRLLLLISTLWRVRSWLPWQLSCPTNIRLLLPRPLPGPSVEFSVGSPTVCVENPEESSINTQSTHLANMRASFPSIRSFFDGEVAASVPQPNATSQPANTVLASPSGSEALAIHSLPMASWSPQTTYEKPPISLLQTGPRRYEIAGRIVNFSTSPGRLHSQAAADVPCYFPVLSDGSGGSAVKLFYDDASAHMPILGQRMTVWATYIADSSRAGTGHFPNVQCPTEIYLGRHRNTHDVFHSHSPQEVNSFRSPIGFDPERDHELLGLMTFENFLSTGYSFTDGKFLVCVGSIGPRKSISLRKNSGTVDMTEVRVFYDTAATVLKLWEGKVASAKIWQPNLTILLVSRSTSRTSDRPGPVAVSEVGLGRNSTVEVEPCFRDAEWLRGRASARREGQRVLTLFPESEFACNDPASSRVLFTLAVVDDEARLGSRRNFTGMLNVLVMKTHLRDCWLKGTTYVAERYETLETCCIRNSG